MHYRARATASVRGRVSGPSITFKQALPRINLDWLRKRIALLLPGNTRVVFPSHIDCAFLSQVWLS